MANKVTCPLCGDNMYLTELQAPKPNGRENKSYIWICGECPGILLEWWDGNDTDAFVRYIDFHEGIIKEWSDEQEETNKSTKHLLDGEY